MADRAKNDAVTLGKILSPHGTAGLVKVFPYSDFPERCRLLREVTVDKEGKRRRMAVESASVHGRFWLLKLEGVDRREDAAALGGALLLIRPEERVPLPAGRYYFDEVIGLRVFSVQGEPLGRVKEIISTGGHDVYVVQGEAEEAGAREILLPAVKEFIKEIDPAKGRMVVQIPAGLAGL